MENSSRSHANGALTAFAAGSIIGLIAGILYAPKRGQESRQLINEKMRMNKDMFKQKMYRAKEAMRTKAESDEALDDNKSDSQSRSNNDQKDKPSGTILKTG